MIIALWTLFTLLIAVWAKKWNHSWLIWVVVSLLISPFIAGLILLLIGKESPKCPSCKKEMKEGSLICDKCEQPA